MAKATKQQMNDVDQLYKLYKEGSLSQDDLMSKAKTTLWLDNKSTSSTTNMNKTNTSTNMNSTDYYGDVSKKSSATKNTGEGIKTSGWLSIKPTAQQDLWNLAQFGADAYTMEWNKSGSLAKRNDIIANNLYLSGEDTEKYLNQFDSFRNASDEDRNNTIRAINERLWIIKQNNWDNNWNLWDNWILGDKGFDDTTAGYYRDADWNEIKIYGYQALSDDQKKYVDQMSDAEKKKISNMWANALQDYIKTWVDENREKEYREDLYGKAKDLRDIQVEQEAIQYWQQLRQAEEQVNNLMQNWEYLWNMGMPGLSKVKLQAVSDSIKEANTSLKELTRLQELSKEASAKNWDIDVAQYEKQISDIVRDLNYKIPQEIQNALNKYTVAELEWNLDTMDGLVAFKKSLLDDLDNNISGMTSASLQQMQYITQSYMDMADKAYEEAKLYKDNQNVVNQEMSAVKGYYVDGNGNAILDSNWKPISVPQSAPLDPVFDKESGKLIQFYYNDDGTIWATYTQVYDGDQSGLQSIVISMLEDDRYTIQDIAKITGMDIKEVNELASMVNKTIWKDGRPVTYGWKNYTAVDSGKVSSVINSFMSKHKEWSSGWQCGSFVNDYLQELGIGRLYGDYLEWHDSGDKTLNMNSSVPVVGWIVIMDSDKCPENWHVAIVTGIKGDKIEVLESNWGGDKKVHKNTYDLNSNKIYGFFDPQKSIDDYNGERSQYSNTNNGWWGLWYEAIYDTAPSEKNNSTENKNYAYWVRMWEADEKIREYENKYKSRWAFGDSQSGESNKIFEWLKSGDRKAFEMYENQFISAVLRQESWANITANEFDRAEKLYFPQPWDTKEQIANKQKARETAIQAMMGQAWKTENWETWVSFYMKNKKTDNWWLNNNVVVNETTDLYER